MSDWKEYRIGDVCRINNNQYSARDNWHHFLYLDTGNITKGKINEFVEFDSFKELPSRARRKVVDGDIVYSMVRPNQEHYGYICNPPVDLLVSTGFVVISANRDIIYPKFLYNYLTLPEITKYLQAIGEQSVCTYPSIKPSDIENLIINIPSLETQKKIASILSSLDDKVENNSKICANLEAQAQALFKSWFVDFEPFKDGEFVESELGMIPKGWKVGTLGELCTFKRGKGLLSQNAIPGNVPVVAGGMEPSCFHNMANTTAPVVTVSGSGANAGFMRMYHTDVWASDCSFIDNSCNNLYFVYCFLSINKRLLKHAQTGAVQPHVKPSDIHNFIVVIPPLTVIDKFQNEVKPKMSLVGTCIHENERLATLRDTLLPKLMSGQIKL